MVKHREDNEPSSSKSLQIYENNNIFPSKITMAKCREDRCIDPGNPIRHNHRLNSVPINYTISVYHREHCQGGAPNRYCLRKKPFEITVGCTCVMTKIPTTKDKGTRI
ncbi:UNVERIFIED_CONTAM: hypothetical protein FKN15_008271 [Acipenser sinensis]